MIGKFIASLLIVLSLGAGLSVKATQANQTPSKSLSDLYHSGSSPMPQRSDDSSYDIKTEEDFIKKSRTYHEIPFSNAHLEFEIHTPENWAPVDLGYETPPEISTRLITLISRYQGPFISTYRPTVSIYAMQLERDILAQHWLQHYALSNGHTPQGDVTSQSDTRASMAWINVADTQSLYTYAVAEITGDIVMMVTLELPLRFKEPLGFLQKRIVDSFRPFAVRNNVVERYRVHPMTDALRLAYPEKWHVQSSNFSNLSRLSVYLANASETQALQGLVLVQAVNRKSSSGLKSELELFRDSVIEDSMGFQIRDFVGEHDFKASSRFIYKRMEVYNGGIKDDPYSRQEMRFAVLGDGNWYIFMVLITPSAQDDLLLWARNTRAFDLMLQSIR